MAIALNSKKVSTALCFTVFGIEIALLFLALFVHYIFHIHLITEGRVIHYLILNAAMLMVWESLLDDQIEQKYQIVLFAFIPLMEIIVINFLGISNGWGLLFALLYCLILGFLFDFKMDDGSSSSGRTTGKIIGKMLGSTIKDLTK